MARIELPEDIIEKIFSRLPVKSLVRFTCLSKKYHLLILRDPVFAKTQYKLASVHHRLLVSAFGSLGLDAPSSFVPSFRFLPTDGREVPASLGSCNGLMFVRTRREFFVCNPSTGLFKKLPSGDYDTYYGHYHGVGYLSATDDYKVVADHLFVDDENYEKRQWVEIFSLREKVWKRIERPSLSIEGEGSLSNEALHWIHKEADGAEHQHPMVVFDFVKEEFRTKQLPDFDQNGKHFRRLGVVGAGILCVLCYPQGAFDSLDFWVMSEYELDDSWYKILNLKLSDPENLKLCGWQTSFLVMGRCTIAMYSGNDNITNIVRIDYKGGKLHLCSIERCQSEYVRATMYEESLLWIDEAPDNPILF